MTSNNYHSYDFINDYYSIKDSNDYHAYLVECIDKMTRMMFKMTNISFCWMGKFKKKETHG